jgi:hypothetical protein
MTAQSVPDFGIEECRYSPVPGRYRLMPHTGPAEKHHAARKTFQVLGRAIRGVRSCLPAPRHSCTPPRTSGPASW